MTDIGSRIRKLKDLWYRCGCNHSLRYFNKVTWDTVMRERDVYYGFEGNYTDYYDDVLKFDGRIIWNGNWVVNGPWEDDIEEILNTIQKQMEDHLEEEKRKERSAEAERNKKAEEAHREYAENLARSYTPLKKKF